MQELSSVTVTTMTFAGIAFFMCIFFLVTIIRNFVNTRKKIKRVVTDLRNFERLRGSEV